MLVLLLPLIENVVLLQAKESEVEQELQMMLGFTMPKDPESLAIILGSVMGTR